MAIFRIFYRVDGGITKRRAAEELMLEGETYTKYFDREEKKRQDANIPTRPILVGATYEDIDESELPVYDSATRSKWRKKVGGGIEIDHSIITRPEKRKILEDDLDTELDKPNPDLKKSMKLQRKLDKGEYD